MKLLNNIAKSQLFVIALYLLVIFLFYFMFPWIEAKTIFFFRSDEAIYLYIHQQILQTSSIPTTLNYIGGFGNYLYPNLYLLLNNLLIISGNSFDLRLASIALQVILFLSLFVSSLTVYKISYLATKNFLNPLFAGLFFITLPIASQRLFYLNATFYANFVGITFLLLFLYYLILYNKDSQKKHLVLSILFYSLTLFTHQLVFMMATIMLVINFLINIFTRKNIFIQFLSGILYVGTAVFINIGYILKTPIFLKILNILGIAKFEQFGQEVVTKASASNLPPLLPAVVLGASVVSAFLLVVSRKNKPMWIISFFFLFIFLSILLNQFGIHLPASFRYDTFFIVSIPLLLSYFIFEVLPSKVLKICMLAFLVGIFSLSTSSIKNSFSIDELDSVKKGLNTLDCKNTVGYYRIAPWIPVLSPSDIYYAHVDIYNAHEDRMNETSTMLFSKDIAYRLRLAQEKNIDCMVYEKNILFVDNIRVKGWEEWRYKPIRNLSKGAYEDKNVAIFKL